MTGLATVERINWVNTVLLLLALVLVITTVVVVDEISEKREFEGFTVTFTDRVHFLAKSIGAAYFQWTEMYDAVVSANEDFIKREFDALLEDFTFAKSVTLEDGAPPQDFFDISGSGDTLSIRFRIYDSRRERFVPDRYVLVVINVPELLAHLNLTQFVPSEDGTEVAYGLKFLRVSSILSVGVLVTIVFIVAVVLLVIVIYNERIIIARYKNTLRSMEIQKRSMKAINDITLEILSGKLEPTYQCLIEKAVEVIPGAQAGSVLVLDGDHFIYAGCVNYDFEKLSKIKFSPNELAQGIDERVKVVTNLGSYNSLVMDDKEKLAILKEVGRIGEIKAMLSAPVKVRDRLIAFVNLDNFETEDAFDSAAVELAEIFASHVGVLFERIELEKELKKQKERLEYLSMHDDLTGLPNRRLLEAEAEKLLALAKREGKRVCVVYLDLEKFKPVNDTYGHKFGDYVLQVIAKRLENSIRKSDIVARLGGDEFVFILYDCKDYLHFVERVSKEISKSIYYNYEELHVAGNFGIAIFPEDGERFEKLLVESDKAMYYAKTNGLLYWLAGSGRKSV